MDNLAINPHTNSDTKEFHLTHNPEIREVEPELVRSAILAYLDSYGHQEGTHGWGEGFTHRVCNERFGQRLSIPFEYALSGDQPVNKYVPLWELEKQGLVDIDEQNQSCYCPHCQQNVQDAELFTSPDYIKERVIQPENSNSIFLISGNRSADEFPVTGFAAGEIIDQATIRRRVLEEYFQVSTDSEKYMAILNKYWTEVIKDQNIPVFWFSEIGTPPCFREVQKEIDLNYQLLLWANKQMQESGIPKDQRFLAAYVSTNVATYKIVTGNGGEVIFVDPSTLDQDNKRVVLIIPISRLLQIYKSPKGLRAFAGDRKLRATQTQKLLSIEAEVYDV